MISRITARSRRWSDVTDVEIMRFVHTADWQIGKPFLRFGEKAEALRTARLDAIEAIGRLAHAQDAPHVLVAGDVFDDETPANVTLRAVLERMRGFAGATWHLLPGNHDPHRAGGLWDRVASLGMPENVRLHLEPVPRALGPEAVLLPAPLRTKSEVRDLTAWMDDAASADGVIRIGLAHGAITRFGGSEGEAGNPIDPARATKARLDHLALGDWHRTREIGPRTWYAGTPEPDRHDSQGVGTALVVDVPAAGAPSRVTPHGVGTFRWARTMLDPVEVPALADVETRLRAAHDPLSRLVLRLDVKGALSIADRRTLEAWLERLEASVFALDGRLALTLARQPGDLEAIDFDGVLRRVAESLGARAEDPSLTLAEREIAADALMMLHLETSDERSAP